MSVAASTQFEFSLIRIQGIDAHKFLQGQLTCDLNELSLGKAILGAQCNPKGRVIHNFFLGQLSDTTFLMQLPQNLVSIAIAALKKYAVFFKVSIEEEEDFKILFTQGNDALPDALVHIEATPDVNIEWVQKESSATSATSLSESLESLLKHGIAFVDLASTEQFTPEDLGLVKSGAINFKKGCYTGQEIVARMHYKGAHKRGVGLFSIEGTLEDINDTSLTVDGKTIGTLINYVERDNQTFILASIPNDYANDANVCLTNRTLTPLPLPPVS